jgi:hypothetical protein
VNLFVKPSLCSAHPLQGFPVQLPTFVARMLAFKLSIDSSKLPAVGDLLRSMAR